jgi:hypothetical protein
MKALDYFLLIGIAVFLIAAYSATSAGKAELGFTLTLCATVYGILYGIRVGGRIHKKNLENK